MYQDPTKSQSAPPESRSGLRGGGGGGVQRQAGKFLALLLLMQGRHALHFTFLEGTTVVCEQSRSAASFALANRPIIIIIIIVIIIINYYY